MKKKIKIIGVIFGAAVLYYGLQYASTAVHYNCYVLKDDCVPPINMTSELVYRSIVKPKWLDKFEIDPTTFSFKDGRFSFWEGEIDGKAVVIRVPENGSPVMQWIFEEELPGGIAIRPASGEHIKQWLESHPEYQLSQSGEQAFDGRNSTFTLDGKQVTLVNGISETDIPNSSAKATTRYFGNESKGNLMGNGNDDIAFLVSQDTGGSGLFYYVVVAYKTAGGYKTTNAFFIGDRIAPQTTHIQSDARELYVNFATRKKGEPFTTAPSQGATLALKVTPDGVLEGLMK